jgi:hypothetical protein
MEFHRLVVQKQIKVHKKIVEEKNNTLSKTNKLSIKFSFKFHFITYTMIKIFHS